MEQIKQEAPVEEVEEEALEVTFESDYAMLQAREFANQFSHATFYMFISNFFGEEIPISAYKKLYDALSNKEAINAEIKVVKGSRSGSFYRELSITDEDCYSIDQVYIKIGEQLILDAIEGETDEIKTQALSNLFKIVLEEYGHYLDYLLRFEYSNIGGDALDDEGAEIMNLMIEELKNKPKENRNNESKGGLSYSQANKSTAKNYFLTTYNPFEDDKIEFAKVTLNDTTHTLTIDFSEFKQQLSDDTERIKQDIKTANEEFFSAGDGDPKFEYYGHLGIERVLEKGDFIDRITLSHIYLGNYMRDMNQLISPLFTYLTDTEKAALDQLEKGLYGFEWLDSIKLTRDGLCRVVEVLAAGQMAKIVGPRKIAKPVGGIGSKLVKPQNVTNNQVKQKIESTFQKLSLKGIQTALDYRLFVKKYGGITTTELGVYRPFEHLDNPLYAVVFDNEKNNEAYYCPPEEQVEIGSYYGFKRYLRNEINGKETAAYNVGKGTGSYVNGRLNTAMTYIEDELKTFYRKYERAKDIDEKNQALRHFGNALHPMEDFFAHTNFTELSLIKLGIAVYPWVDVNAHELINYNNTGQRFVIENPIKKEVKKSSTRVFKSKEAIKSAYPNFEMLDKFAVKGFYFSSKQNTSNSNEEIFLASPKDNDVWEVHPAINTNLVKGGVDYIRQLPLVSGYFSSYDTIATLTHMMNKVIKSKEISLKGVLMENDGISGSSWEKYALDLGDMLIINILTDLKVSQKEKNKPGKETGLDYAKLLDCYASVIEYRQIIISVLAAIKKRIH